MKTRKVARKKPPAAEPDHWRSHITISLPKDVEEQLRAAAEADGRSVSNYLVQMFLREQAAQKG
ncbi:MAG TPA: Arc family DNA-binding protein [Candidatus Polarisedimenticolia bacterium]|nr:Arc family DNA-binding protein [Candidatus Polarisedimenticolia bacterium]